MRLLYATLVLMLLECSGAASASEPAAADVCQFSTIDAFDPELAPDARRRAVDALAVAAAHPDCDSGPDYQLGLLYRHGPDLPGNPLPRDAARARELIGRAAREGRIQGYAELAEMALADGDAPEAMRWTQGYLLEVRRAGIAGDFDLQGYNADLLRRAAGALKRAGLPSGGKALTAALKAHLAREQSAREADQALGQTSQVGTAAGAASASLAEGLGDEIDLRVKRRPTDDYDLRELLLDGGRVDYLLEVQPDGRVSRIVVETFSPTWRHAQVLRQLVEAFEFHPHTAAEPQVVRIPVIYGYVGPDGPRLKRQR